MLPSKTVVYYNILGSGELVFFLPKEHITSQEASWLNLQHGYTFEKDYRFSGKQYMMPSNLQKTVHDGPCTACTAFKQYMMSHSCCVHRWQTKYRHSRQLMLGRGRRRYRTH